MSVQITVSDPANTSPAELSLVVDMIKYFIANNNYAAAPRRVDNVSAPAIPIAPNDSPDAGGVADAFNAAAGNPAAAFAVTSVPAPGSTFATGAGLPAARTPEQLIADNWAKTHPAPGAAVDLDSEGLPYDARIHAKSANGPSKIADGTWRAKRGVDAGVVAQVKAELRQLMGATGAPLTPPAPAAVPAAPNVPPAPIQPAASPAAPAGAVTGFAAPAAIDFIGLVEKVGPLITSGRLTQAETETACTTYGVANLSLLLSRPDLVPQVNAMIDAIVASKA